MSPITRKIRFATWCAASVAAATLVAFCFRATMERIFVGDRGMIFLHRATLIGVMAAACGLAWFFFVLICLSLHVPQKSTSEEVHAAKQNSCSTQEQWARTLAWAVSAALVVATTADLVLQTNDQLFSSRLLPWVRPVIWMQTQGFREAWTLFLCQPELKVGCEPYKWLAAFIVSNAIVYFPLVLIGRIIYCRYSWFRSGWPRLKPLIIRCGALLGSVGLCTRLFLYGMEPGVGSPVHAFDFDRLLWTVLDNATGIFALLLFLLTPFSAFKLLRNIRLGNSALPDVADLTWLASFLIVALFLGNQFLS
jgi:hypothetical protein